MFARGAKIVIINRYVTEFALRRVVYVPVIRACVGPVGDHSARTLASYV